MTFFCAKKYTTMINCAQIEIQRYLKRNKKKKTTMKKVMTTMTMATIP
jgi:hypothetical protein